MLLAVVETEKLVLNVTIAMFGFKASIDSLQSAYPVATIWVNAFGVAATLNALNILTEET